MGKLTALKVKNAKAPGRYTDSRGLMLVIGKDGSRKWVMRVQYGGRRRDIGLGSAIDVPLSEARDTADEVRRMIRQGLDPIAERRRAREGGKTFRETALAAYEEIRGTWKNAKHGKQWLATLEAHAFPSLGDLAVDKIDGPMVRDVLADIWLTIPETARRVRQRIGTVMDYAHAKGWRPHPIDMRAVSKGLPKQPKADNHLTAMPWQDVPAFVAGMADKLTASEPVLLALEFLILTGTRSGEVRGARWSEIDLAGKVWTIPAERMKAGKPHRVPLSARAVAILEHAAELRLFNDPDGLLFEGTKPGRPFSDMTWTRAIRRAGIDATVHGFRSSFRDWMNEATNTPHNVAEAALAHVVKDQTERAYSRSDLFDKRRAVMDAWGLFVSGAAGTLVPLARKA